MPFYPNFFLFLILLFTLTMMISQRHHLLMALLYLELMMLSLTMMLTMTFSYFDMFFLLVILTFGACEASLGLSLLISMTRTYGSDTISLLTINKC